MIQARPSLLIKFLGFQVAFSGRVVKVRVLVCLEAPSMELQERLVLDTERDTAVKSRRMLNHSRVGRVREEAILASCHRCD